MVSYTRSMDKSILFNKIYRGITDDNCLYWCHGTVGLEHHKVRKLRYPLWKYAHVSHRVIICICLNCNMQFYGALAMGVPLKIPVVKTDSYFDTAVPVTWGGKRISLRGQVIGPWRAVTQSMLTDETRAFIELVQ